MYAEVAKISMKRYCGLGSGLRPGLDRRRESFSKDQELAIDRGLLSGLEGLRQLDRRRESFSKDQERTQRPVNKKATRTFYTMHIESLFPPLLYSVAENSMKSMRGQL